MFVHQTSQQGTNTPTHCHLCRHAAVGHGPSGRCCMADMAAPQTPVLQERRQTRQSTSACRHTMMRACGKSH